MGGTPPPAPQEIGPTTCFCLCLWVSVHTPAVAVGAHLGMYRDLGNQKRSTKGAPTPDSKNISRRHEAAD
jgi:hypothetical protein